MKSRYSIEEKLEWMRMLEQGKTVYYVSKITGWNKNDIGIMWKKYQERGIDALNDKERKKFLPQEKISIVRDMKENSLSLNETAIKYDVSVTSLMQWRRIIRKYGEAGILSRRHQGRKIKSGRDMRKPKTKYSQKEYERVLEENKHLKAEIELLKKYMLQFE